MVFTTESQIVKNYVLLIDNDLKTIEQVPDIYNLREIIILALNQS